jgi:tRNA modification GTPase
VRLSGPRACELCDALFDAGNDGFAPGASYVAREGRLRLGGDWPPVPAAVYFMRAPTSYTREDVVEFHIVGAIPVLRALVSALLAAGARMAEPGEFTRRAYLNGRIDLAQAEAVQQVIRARNEAELRLSLANLRGALSEQVEALRAELIALCAQVETALDFADQDIEPIGKGELAQGVSRIRRRIEELAAGGRSRAVRAEVPRVLFCGAPNAGKSSLFNALLQTDRAIVSPHPGTTRDLIEATLAVRDLELNLIDSAGVGATTDDLERLAAGRSEAAAQTADIILLVIDSSRPLAEADRTLLTAADPVRSLVALAKRDLPQACRAPEVQALAPGLDVAETSARTGQGVAELAARLREMILSGRADRGAAHYILEARHEAALREAAAALTRAGEIAATGDGLEFVALELRAALDALGVIVGPAGAGTEDILDRIFAEFCIGK